MLYYNKNAEGKIETFTNSEKLAQLKVSNNEWNEYFSTDEEIVMQSDGNGYCLKSDYIEPDTRIDDLTKEYEECVKGLKDYMTIAILMDDEELQSDLKDEYAEINASYDEQIIALESEV